MFKKKTNIIKSVLVLGSTSIVAKSICLHLADHNKCKRFHLIARNLKANKGLKNTLKNEYGAIVTEECVDLLDHLNFNTSIMPNVENFDLYLITAGSLGQAKLARSDIAEAFRITAANYLGIIPWITTIASEERIRKPGKLWVFSSVAADRGRPSNYHYGAAKAGLTTFCQGLLLRCTNKPFSVRIIKAGFINTPMTDGKAPKLLCINPKFVAKHLLRNPNRRGIEYLPYWWAFIMFIVRILPKPIASKL